MRAITNTETRGKRGPLVIITPSLNDLDMQRLKRFAKEYTTKKFFPDGKKKTYSIKNCPMHEVLGHMINKLWNETFGD